MTDQELEAERWNVRKEPDTTTEAIYCGGTRLFVSETTALRDALAARAPELAAEVRRLRAATQAEVNFRVSLRSGSRIAALEADVARLRAALVQVRECLEQNESDPDTVAIALVNAALGVRHD